VTEDGAWTWVAYVDETFNDAAYWICALLVHVDRIRSAQTALDDVVSRWGVEFEVDTRAELHGGDLWHGSGAFAGVPPRVRRGICDDALDALVAAEPRIILRGVARRQLRYANPHRIAWRYTIETVDEEMTKVAGRALVVADEHETEAALRGDIVEYVAGTTGGWKPRPITRVLPGLRFSNSNENRLLQAADLAAFLHQRRTNVPIESNARAQGARESQWRKLANWVVVDRLWTPP
jgi:hypothetical protein